jgi:hypothetical protein
MKKVLAILRAERFSPNSVEKDRAIMMSVVQRLQDKGYEVEVISEEAFATLRLPLTTDHYTTVFSMGRLPETLARLKDLKIRVINTPEGVERCARSLLESVMREAHIPTPPKKGDQGYWLKRGDAAAQEKNDVVFAANEEELNEKVNAFRSRGIADYTVSAHVVGDVVKFYGVLGTGFFRYYYPTDDGQTKFGDESRNGTASHYRFDTIDLQQASERLAAAVGVSIYGGDCIVRQDGTWCIIDFNDWPSFSRCRKEAAEAIVDLVENSLQAKRQSRAEN